MITSRLTASFRAVATGQLPWMIARIWRGAVRADDAAAYEFITVSFWDSRQAIEAFAGPDISTAVYYPDDERFLIERDPTVNHYEIAGPD